MTAERSRQLRHVYREAEPRAASAKFLNHAARAPDAAWRALVTNGGRPPIPTAAQVPTNAIVAQPTAGEAFVAMASGKLLATAIASFLGEDALPPANSGRPSLAPGAASPANAIAPLLEEAGETT